MHQRNTAVARPVTDVELRAPGGQRIVGPDAETRGARGVEGFEERIATIWVGDLGVFE